jgi:hypothetical protein
LRQFPLPIYLCQLGQFSQNCQILTNGKGKLLTAVADSEDFFKCRLWPISNIDQHLHHNRLHALIAAK